MGLIFDKNLPSGRLPNDADAGLSR